MITWATWYDYMMPELPGIEPSLVDAYLRRAAIEFCEETGIYTVTLAPVSIVANTPNYAMVSPDAQAEAFQAKAVWVDGTPMDYAPLDALQAAPTLWTTATAEKPTAYTQLIFSEVYLAPNPTIAYTNGLTISAALRPTLTATGLADQVASQYFSDIAAGARAMLMGMPNKPWTSPEGEMKYRAQFEAAKTNATIDVNRSIVPSTLSVKLIRIK